MNIRVENWDNPNIILNFFFRHLSKTTTIFEVYVTFPYKYNHIPIIHLQLQMLISGFSHANSRLAFPFLPAPNWSLKLPWNLSINCFLLAIRARVFFSRENNIVLQFPILLGMVSWKRKKLTVARNINICFLYNLPNIWRDVQRIFLKIDNWW